MQNAKIAITNGKRRQTRTKGMCDNVQVTDQNKPTTATTTTNMLKHTIYKNGQH